MRIDFQPETRRSGMAAAPALRFSIVRSGQPVTGIYASPGDQVVVDITGANPVGMVMMGIPGSTIVAGFADSSGSFKQTRTIGANWQSDSFAQEGWWAGGAALGANSWGVRNGTPAPCPDGSQTLPLGSLIGIGTVVSIGSLVYLVSPYGLFSIDRSVFAASPYSKSPFVLNPATPLQVALPTIGAVHPDNFMPYLSNPSGYTMDLSGIQSYDPCTIQAASSTATQNLTADRGGACQAEGGTWTNGQCFPPGSPNAASVSSTGNSIAPIGAAVGAALVWLLLRGL